MAAYQHRNWEEALDRFGRLKELQPSRPGLDALLDEVRWFLQLQETAPLSRGGAESNSADGGEAQSKSASDPSAGTQAKNGTGRRPLWQTVSIIVLTVVGVVALVLTAFQGRLPWTAAIDREAQELYNRGQSRLNVGDYEGAEAAFRKLLDISPGDPEALLGISRAERQQTLAQGYAAVEAAIAQEDWDAAAAEIEKILAVDSSYADAQARSDFIAQRRRLASLYSDASRLYDLGQWQDAITQFEKIRELDTTYRTEAVAEFLFVCYLNAGANLIREADGAVPTVQLAIEYFSRALAIHPRNRSAADARRLGSLYLDAMRVRDDGALLEASQRLSLLVNESPAYAEGQAAQQLYGMLLEQAREALASGDIPAALRWYRDAKKVPVADQSEATEGEALALSITPTPTPRPTSTPIPTRLPDTPTPSAIARAGNLNLRAGPGIAYPVVGQILTDAPLAVTGRNSDGSWLVVCCVNGGSGWVAAGFVDVQGSLTGLPVITPAIVPTSTPAPMPTSPSTACISGAVRSTQGEQPLADWTITLTRPDGTTATQRTNGSGFYQFLGLRSGAFQVSQTVLIGWRSVSPQSTGVTLTAGSDCLVVDFWNEQTGSQSGPQPPPTETVPVQPTATRPR